MGNGLLICGAENTFLDEVILDETRATVLFADTDHCARQQKTRRPQNDNGSSLPTSSANGLTCYYGTKWLREYFGVEASNSEAPEYGESGSGKTTLLVAIAQLEPDTGTALPRSPRRNFKHL